MVLGTGIIGIQNFKGESRFSIRSFWHTWIKYGAKRYIDDREALPQTAVSTPKPNNQNKIPNTKNPFEYIYLVLAIYFSGPALKFTNLIKNEK